MKYNIGTICFNSKKHCYAYTSNIIKQLGECEIKNNNINFVFFDNLFNNHLEKQDKLEGFDIVSFIIKKHKMYNQLQMFVKRSDNSIVNFSYKYCCEFKPRTNKYYLIRAMRNSIASQILKFKADNIKVCAFCGIRNDNTEYHVDHHNPSFNKLFNDFTELNNKEITKFEEDETTNLTYFHSDDILFQNDWIKYHQDNCYLQILCKKCNLSKPKD